MTTAELQQRLEQTYPDTESAVELSSMIRFSELEWELVHAEKEIDGDPNLLGRMHQGEVVLKRFLQPILRKLNPNLPDEALEQAINQFCRDRFSMSIVQANRDVYHLLKQGAAVHYRDEHGHEQTAKAYFIDWQHPNQNHFLLVSQFWVAGDPYRKRADLVGFVNGIPMLFVELKAPHVNVQDAYYSNLKDYRTTIPQLFWYNAFSILSNGGQAKMAAATSEWEHYSEWKKINEEGEQGIISLDTLLQATCEKNRFVDLLENFIIFQEMRGGLVKIVAKNHQYLGVNNAIHAFQKIRENQGKLGVFWHTQGSGKSASMIFFGQKVLRKFPGRWTFVVVTDRNELDDQIYGAFQNSGTVVEEHVQAASSHHLRQLLHEDHRFIFTLIHKFRTEDGQKHPVLSSRDDIIVITDEAHRSQYDTLAQNMRDALPKAAFLGFTGTPLIKGEEERTREVFGEYVSIYNFRQSIEDGATVPLYYENRIPELQLKNEYLNDDLNRLLDQAMLDDQQERRLEREFSKMYQIVTRDERLERIAEDVVQHFMGRVHRGKAMFIAIDKATAIKMYDKVKKHWQAMIMTLESQLRNADKEGERAISEKINYMQSTDMAVVVSAAQNEVENLKQKGVEILPHRRRMVKEDLETKFKDPENPLRIVFVCAMWMTGFDVPSCSTIYLDKPMRNHTLMQTIARANRVWKDKTNGLIVDYVGVFRSLEKALAIYAAPGATGVDMPIKDKEELHTLLINAIDEVRHFLADIKVDLYAIRNERDVFKRINLKDAAVEAILVNEGTKKQYMTLSNWVLQIYKAYLPNSVETSISELVYLIHKIGMQMAPPQPADMSDVIKRMEAVLDRSVAGFKIQEPEGGYKLYDLSQIDFEELRRRFEKGRKRMMLDHLQSSIEEKLSMLIKANSTRMDFMVKYKQMLREYTDGVKSVDEIYEQLLTFGSTLVDEEKRCLREGLDNEEQLAIFDLITRPDQQLTKEEIKEIKLIARQLLETLQREKMVLDWRKKQQARAGVKSAIATILDRLPPSFTKELYNEKCDLIYKYVYNLIQVTPEYAK